jgi:hypothetical protein
MTSETILLQIDVAGGHLDADKRLRVLRLLSFKLCPGHQTEFPLPVQLSKLLFRLRKTYVGLLNENQEAAQRFSRFDVSCHIESGIFNYCA